MIKKEEKIKLGLYITPNSKNKLDELKTQQGISASDLVDSIATFDFESFQQYFSIFLKQNKFNIEEDEESFFYNISSILQSFPEIESCDIIPKPSASKILDTDLTLVFIEKSGDIKIQNSAINKEILDELLDSSTIYAFITNIASFFLSKRNLVVLLQNLENLLEGKQKYIPLYRKKDISVDMLSSDNFRIEEYRFYLSLEKATKIKTAILHFLTTEEKQVITF